MPLNKIPALPVPLGQANTPWPTFSLSATERRAIAQGTVPTVKLGAGGTILSGSPQYVTLGNVATLPNVPPVSAPPPNTVNVSKGPVRSSGQAASANPPTINLPPVTTSGNQSTINLPPVTISSNQSTINLPPITTPGGTIVRGGASIPSGQGAPLTRSFINQRSLNQLPTSQLTNQIVRSSGGAPSSSNSNLSQRPLSSPLPLPTSLRASSVGRLALAAFIGPFITMIALAISFAVKFAPADLIVLFGTGLLSDSFGIIVLRTRRNNDRPRLLAGWGISLATISMVVEIISMVVQATHK